MSPPPEQPRDSLPQFDPDSGMRQVLTEEGSVAMYLPLTERSPATGNNVSESKGGEASSDAETSSHVGTCNTEKRGHFLLPDLQDKENVCLSTCLMFCYGNGLHFSHSPSLCRSVMRIQECWLKFADQVRSHSAHP